MSFSDVHPGDPIIAANVQQVIDALKGTSGKGIPLAVSAVNDSARYALTLENTEATNSRALNVLKNDGSVLIRADATGVTLGAPLNLPTGSVTSTAIADGTIATVDIAVNAVQQQLGQFAGGVTFSTTSVGSWVATPITVNVSTAGG